MLIQGLVENWQSKDWKFCRISTLGLSLASALAIFFLQRENSKTKTMSDKPIFDSLLKMGYTLRLQEVENNDGNFLIQ